MARDSTTPILIKAVTPWGGNVTPGGPEPGETEGVGEGVGSKEGEGVAASVGRIEAVSRRSRELRLTNRGASLCSTL